VGARRHKDAAGGCCGWRSAAGLVRAMTTTPSDLAVPRCLGPCFVSWAHIYSNTYLFSYLLCIFFPRTSVFFCRWCTSTSTLIYFLDAHFPSPRFVLVSLYCTQCRSVVMESQLIYNIIVIIIIVIIAYCDSFISLGGLSAISSRLALLLPPGVLSSAAASPAVPGLNYMQKKHGGLQLGNFRLDLPSVTLTYVHTRLPCA
jgi:hypothetical protein